MEVMAPPGRDAAACNQPMSPITSKKSLQKTAIIGPTPSPSCPRPWLPRSHKSSAGITAETARTALTLPRGREKRHITDEAPLVDARDRVRQDQRGDGVLRVAWDKQVEPTTHDAGRGRGAVPREKRVVQKTCSPITHLAREEDTLAAHCQRVGWKALVTKAGHQRLSLPEAVWCSRNAYRVARLFHRLNRSSGF
jgi:hypothetical protein